MEPCHSVTWLLRPLFCPSKMPMFSHKKTCLRGHPVNTANNHILKSQAVQSFIILPSLYGHSNQLCSSFHYLCSMTSIVSIFEKIISALTRIKELLFRNRATVIYLRHKMCSLCTTAPSLHNKIPIFLWGRGQSHTG